MLLSIYTAFLDGFENIFLFCQEEQSQIWLLPLQELQMQDWRQFFDGLREREAYHCCSFPIRISSVYAIWYINVKISEKNHDMEYTLEHTLLGLYTSKFDICSLLLLGFSASPRMDNVRDVGLLFSN